MVPTLRRPRAALLAAALAVLVASFRLVPQALAAPPESLAPAAPAGAQPDSQAPAASPAPAAPRRVRLFYATDRAPTGKSKLTQIYGTRWGEVRFGSCDVEMPASHRRGEVERNTERWMRGAGSPLRKVRLRGVSPAARDSFFLSLRESVGASGQRSVFVFVHGFNVPFERAARFAAQIAYDLNCDVVPVLFSWPASRVYMADEEAVQWARWDLLAFLKRLRAAVPEAPVHLMSYSMGTRTMMEALSALAESPAADSTRFDQVIFAAADIENRVFERAVPGIRRVAGRVTLYVSSSDRALRTSRAAHRLPRIGLGRLQSGALAGVDVIDVSRTRADALGHGYIFEVLADVRELIVAGTAPGARSTLVPVGTGDGQGWRLRRK